MKAQKLIVYAVLVGILAGLVTLFTDVLQNFGFISNGISLTFVTFVCWATYFLYGATPKGALSGWVSMIVGVICAIIIYVCDVWFMGTGMNQPYVALPLAVVIGVILMCLGEKLPVGNNVAAIFVGAGLFFGTMGSVGEAATYTLLGSGAGIGYIMAGIGELAYAALGLFAGFLTIQISNFVNPPANQKAGQ